MIRVRSGWIMGALTMVAVMVPQMAQADEITVSDPIIGVRGGSFGSPPIDSGAVTEFGACPESLDLQASFTCIPFQITEAFEGGISAITVQIDKVGDDAALVFLRDSRSQFFLTDLGNGLIQLSARPDFPAVVDNLIDSHPVIGDIVDFLLPPVLQCPNDSGWGRHPCGVGEDLLLYISGIPIQNGPNTVPVDFTAAMQTVNGQSVPEPATLLLFGTGAAMLAGARRRLKA